MSDQTPSGREIIQMFGTWNRALEASGATPPFPPGDVDFIPDEGVVTVAPITDKGKVWCDAQRGGPPPLLRVEGVTYDRGVLLVREDVVASLHASAVAAGLDVKPPTPEEIWARHDEMVRERSERDQPWYSGGARWQWAREPSAGVRGPYGTNLGDIWLGAGSEIQHKLDAEGNGMVLIHEVMDKDGVVEECLYVTKDPELIEMAYEGTVKYVAQRASEN